MGAPGVLWEGGWSRCQSFVAISSLTVLMPKLCPFISVEMVGVVIISDSVNCVSGI